MKIFISPAKSLNFEDKIKTKFESEPIFTVKANKINNIIKDLSAPDISNLMSISPKLGELNWSRNQDFQSNSSNEKQAIFAFNGDVYSGLDVNSISEVNYCLLYTSDAADD